MTEITDKEFLNLLNKDLENDEEYEKFDNKLKLIHEREYSNVKSWTDLCNANVEFLEGKHLVTFYHYGPINFETSSKPDFLNDIIELNKKGFFTVNSQPHEDSCNVMQKSYIEFYCQEEIAINLLPKLQKDTSFYYSYYQLSNSSLIDNYPNERYGLTYYTEPIWGKYKKSDYADKEWRYCTNWNKYPLIKYLKSTFNGHIYCENKDFILNLINNSVHIFIAGREFDKTFSAPKKLLELIDNI